MSYVTLNDLAQVRRRRKARRYFVPAVTQRTSDDAFSMQASAAGEKVFEGMAFEAKAVEDAPIVSEQGPGSFEPSDIDPGLGQLPIAVTAQTPASLGLLNKVATACAVGAVAVLGISWVMGTKEKATSNSKGKLRCPECGEAAKRLARPIPRAGWALAVDQKRLEHGHMDGEPLCPVMTSKGYQPALPTRK